jgi:hypothetical protein
MGRTIWTFGDSFTQSMAPVPRLNDWRKKYEEYKGHTPKVFSEFLINDYGYTCHNRGHGGADNYTILDIIIDHLDQIKDDHIVVIGWSSIHRTRLSNKFGKFTSILPGGDDKFKKDNATLMGVSPNTIEDVLVNRFQGSCYVTELNRIIKLLNHTFKNNIIIHWSPFYGFHQGMDVISLPNVQTIFQETEGKIEDSHYSENGHEVIAEHINQLIHYTIRNNEKFFTEFDEPVKQKRLI